MNNKEIELKIKSLYNECLQLEQKISANKTKVNSYMQKFVVGYQIGSGVYNDDYPTGYDINLSGNIEDYKEAVRLINSDIDDIDLLLSKVEEIKKLMVELPLTNELLDVTSKALDLAQKMYQEKENRLAILEQLRKIYSLLEEQEGEMRNNTSSNVPGSSSSSGVSPSSNSGNIPSSNTNKPNTNTNTNPQNNTNTGFEEANYPALISYNLENADMNVAKDNLASHAENVKSILANVSVNGEVIGGDVYGVTGVNTDSDIGFNFGALQLACDAVNADVNAISAYITQMHNKISSNKTAITAIKAEMDRTETVTGTDKDGNVYSYERKVHSGAEIAAYQAEIDAMEAENKQLEADIVSYTEQMNSKKEVYNQLNNLRNTYNKVYGGLLNTFAANDLINTLSKEGPDSSLFGMSLSDSQKAELFNNLGSSLLNEQNNLSLTLGEGFNLMNGEYPLGAFQYLLGACTILGGNEDTFGKNFTKFQEYQQSISANLEYNEQTNKDSSVNDDSKNSNQLNSSNNSSSGLMGVNGRPISNKALNSVVEQFMLDNTGNLVAIPKDVKNALDLQLDALISIPRDYSTTEEFPLLMWLAGTGTAGGDVENLKSSTFIKNVVNGQYTIDSAIMYVPCGWGSGSSAGNNSTYDGTILNHDFNNIVNGLNVDKDHVSGMGISVGAFALAYLVDNNPNTFASAAMCGGGFGGPFNYVSIDHAIETSPGTSFIWYNADNDETSRDRHGNGVRTNSLNQHQALLDAGMNSVYYEVGGNIWHTEACDRFVTDAMVRDLISIERGQKYSLPTGVQHISATDAYNASITHGSIENNWYRPMSYAPTNSMVPGYTQLSTNTSGNDQSINQSENIPDIFKNIKGTIPDITTIEETDKILRSVTIPRYKMNPTPPFTRDTNGLNPYYIKDNFIVYSQIGNHDENGQFVRNGWDNAYKQKETNGEYSTNWHKDIATAGCSVTSAAMVVSNLTNQNVTPDYIKTLYHNNNANIGYGFAHDVFDAYNLDYASGISVRRQDNNGTYYYDNVLKNGGAIINTVNEGGHYIAILGVDDSGDSKKYFVADPYLTSPGKWIDENSPAFAPIKNGYNESSMVIAPPGMDINQALAAPGSTPSRQYVVNHRFGA